MVVIVVFNVLFLAWIILSGSLDKKNADALGGAIDTTVIIQLGLWISHLLGWY